MKPKMSKTTLINVSDMFEELGKINNAIQAIDNDHCEITINFRAINQASKSGEVSMTLSDNDFWDHRLVPKRVLETDETRMKKKWIDAIESFQKFMVKQIQATGVEVPLEDKKPLGC